MALRPAALVLVAIFALACDDSPVASPFSRPSPNDPSLPTIDATVRFLDLEGGCWTITPDERVHYLPLNLPAEFRRDGLPVRVAFAQRNDYASVCMVGPVIEIRFIHGR